MKIRKKLLSVLLAAAMVLSLMPQLTLTALADSTVWDGTTVITWYNDTDTEFTITTAEELAGLAYLVNNSNTFSGKTVKLGADIALNDVSSVANWAITAPAHTWTAVGTSTYSFSGTFDGGGHTVSGLYISSSSSYQGLFGNISGTVQDVGVVDSYISVNAIVGGVVGYNNGGTVTSCYNTGVVIGSVTTGNYAGSFAGGVVGRIAGHGTVEYCWNTGDVAGGKYYVGGIAGSNDGGTVEYCRNTGSVTGSESCNGRVGGVVGNNSGTVTGCCNTGNVSCNSVAGGSATGGVAGRNVGTVISCYNTGTINGYNDVGGVVGIVLAPGAVTDCYNTGTVTSSNGSYVGGVFGDNYGGIVTSCYSAGSVSGSSYVGGVAGSSDGTVTGCYYDKQMCAVGGINDVDTSGAAGLLTSALATGTAFSGWNGGDTGVWNFTDGLYPRLTGYVDAGTDYEMDVTDAAYLSASPVTLASTDSDTYETVELVSTGFSVSTANGVVWASSSTGLVVGSDGAVTMSAGGTNVVLTATRGSLSKTVTLSSVVAYTISAIEDQTLADLTAGYGSQVAKTITITRTGNGDLTSLAVALGGTNSGSFTITQPSATTLNDTTTFTAFTLKAADGLTAGSYTATVTVSADNMKSATFTVGVTVFSTPPSYTASVSPDSKTFDAAEAGYGTQTAQEFTITNTGTGILTGLSAALTSGTDFEISTALSGTSIASGSTATVSVRPVTGLSEGTYTDTLTITEDNGISLSVSLSFTVSAATAYDATVTPPSKTFNAAEAGYGTQTAQEFTITNTGTGILTGLSAALTSGTDFEISTALSGSTITSGSTASVSVRPVTGLSEGTYTDTLTITEDNGTTLTVSLSFTVSAANLSTYTITASAGSGGSISPSGSVSVASNGNQTFTITANSNYSISSVTVDNVSQGAISTYTFTGVAADHTISATFSYTGGSSSRNTQTSYSATMSGDGSGQLAVTVDEDAGNASATLSDTQGKLISGGKTLVIIMPEIDVVSDYILGIPVSSLSSDSGNGSLTLNTGAGNVTLPSDMLTGTDAVSGDTAKIEIGLVDSSELSDEARDAVGDRPLVSLTLYIDGTQTDWSNSEAPVTVSIPYTPADGEDLNAIVIWYIDGDGNLNCVQNGHYDSETGTATFQTTHFSLYAVGYNGVSFKDVAGNAWYADYVSFLAARGIVAGNNGTFSPDASITRAEFATILARMSGDDLSGYTSSAFTDVAVSDWYFAAVQWAYENGVASGYDGKFNPNVTITRQDIAVMLARYAEKVTGYTLPKTIDSVAFTDASDIAAYATDAVAAMQQAGIISGNNGNFAPTENATRAQAAKMIAVLLQSMIKAK